MVNLETGDDGVGDILVFTTVRMIEMPRFFIIRKYDWFISQKNVTASNSFKIVLRYFGKV